MSETTTDAWRSWQQQISRHLGEYGLLPTPTTAGLQIPVEIVSEGWKVADTCPDDLPSLCRLTDAMGTATERAAVLLFLSYLSNGEPYLRLPEAEESGRRTAIGKLYSDAVSLLPAEQLESAWRIRWELLFAASAGLWDRTRELINQWRVLAPSEEQRALTAQARINFLSVHPARSSDWVFDWWSPYEGSGYPEVGDLFACLFAARLDERRRLDSAPWLLPRTLQTDQFARVLGADNVILQLQDAGSVSPMLRFVGAWCSAVVAVRLNNKERMRDAAQQYAVLARDPNLPKPLFGARDEMRRLPAWSAAMLFREIGDLDAAREITIFWTQVDPESADGWKFRAELERQTGIEWSDSYKRYMDLSPETDESWEHSELLRLLLESRDQEAADRALRALAFEHVDRPVVEEMLTWDWPTYTQLHESTRERWWHGLIFVCDSRVCTAFRCAPWRYAAACFGEAVALELRARVFDPLRATIAIDRQALTAREAGIANAIVTSRATLGMMIVALKLTTNRDSELGQAIKRFVGQRHRPLQRFFQSRQAVERLKTATEGRNEAVHGDITADEAKQIYSEARKFLDVLVEEDPRCANT